MNLWKTTSFFVFFGKKLFTKASMWYNGYINKRKERFMRIQIKDKSNNGEVFVWGLCGPKTIDHILNLLNEDIRNVNKSLRELQEVL